MDSPALLEESTEQESPLNEPFLNFDDSIHALPTVAFKEQLLTQAETEPQ